jgi:hypothetical protein
VAAGREAAAMATCLRPGQWQVRLTVMVSGTGSNPEDEYADDQYADYDAEDREQPSVPTTSPKMTCSNSVRRSLTATTTGNVWRLIGLARAGGSSLAWARQTARSRGSWQTRR